MKELTEDGKFTIEQAALDIVWLNNNEGKQAAKEHFKYILKQVGEECLDRKFPDGAKQHIKKVFKSYGVEL